jgi:thioredoxin 1
VLGTSNDLTITVTDADFESRVLRSELPVLVDFWATWCPPCYQLAPVLSALASEYAGRVTFATLDVDANQLTTIAYGVRGMPTMLLFRDGEVIGGTVGAQPKSRLKDQLDAWLASSA